MLISDICCCLQGLPSWLIFASLSDHVVFLQLLHCSRLCKLDIHIKTFYIFPVGANFALRLDGICFNRCFEFSQICEPNVCPVMYIKFHQKWKQYKTYKKQTNKQTKQNKKKHKNINKTKTKKKSINVVFLCSQRAGGV